MATICRWHGGSDCITDLAESLRGFEGGYRLKPSDEFTPHPTSLPDATLTRLIYAQSLFATAWAKRCILHQYPHLPPPATAQNASHQAQHSAPLRLPSAPAYRKSAPDLCTLWFQPAPINSPPRISLNIVLLIDLLQMVNKTLAFRLNIFQHFRVLMISNAAPATAQARGLPP